MPTWKHCFLAVSWKISGFELRWKTVHEMGPMLRRIDVKTRSILLSLRDGNPPGEIHCSTNGGFPSQRVNDVEFWRFLCCLFKPRLQERGSVECILVLGLNKLLNTQSSWPWFETPQRSCVTRLRVIEIHPSIHGPNTLKYISMG